MVPSLLFDLTNIDLDKVICDSQAIEQVNPHRGCMRLLDAIVHHNENFSEAAAYRDVRQDEFWVPGHIPGRPLFPGVLMIEAAAQLASFMSLNRMKVHAFMGFVGCESVKFRNQVVPGDRLHIISKEVEFRRRRWTCASQGLVRGNLVFEATIIGMAM
jgi:3-hydroxyacyl-[acyl-carrier-protein] dehydratase